TRCLSDWSSDVCSSDLRSGRCPSWRSCTQLSPPAQDPPGGHIPAVRFSTVGSRRSRCVPSRRKPNRNQSRRCDSRRWEPSPHNRSEERRVGKEGKLGGG